MTTINITISTASLVRQLTQLSLFLFHLFSC